MAGAKENVYNQDAPIEELSTSTNRFIGNQIVFRVKDPRKPPRAKKAITSGGSTRESAYRSRKSHHKSRSGCKNCKQRRVKCDETRPHCQKCEAYGVRCDYVNVSSQNQKAVTQRLRACDFDEIDTTVFSMSIAQVGNNILRVLRSTAAYDGELGQIPSLTIKKGPSVLNYFIEIMSQIPTLSDSGRAVMKGDVLRLAFQTPHLMHTILGVSYTVVQFTSDDKSHKLAEAYHWGHAIQLYKKALQTPVQEHNMDALMSTCMMIGFLSFSEREYDPRNSWVFSSRPTDLNWLLVHSGLRYLIESSIPWLSRSIWWTFFMESDDENKTFDDHRPGREGLDQGLADLCDITDTTTTDGDNPYHWPLRMLAPLMDLPLVREHFSKFTTFMGRLEPPYTTLLLQKDPRACLILAVWMGKMCEQKHVGMWFRFQAECTGLCIFLENSEDVRILKALEFPASRCGYLLKHQREEARLLAKLDMLEYL